MRVYSLVTSVLTVLASAALGNAQSCATPGECPPGYTLVEEVCYRDVVRCCCRVVPDIQKRAKVCYDMKCVPFCELKMKLCGYEHCSPCGGACGQDCQDPPSCGKLRTRKILLKKVVTYECPGWKCVVEKVCERVPYKVYRMVPCGAPACAPVSALTQPQNLPLVSAAAGVVEEQPRVYPAAVPMPTGVPQASDTPEMLPVSLPLVR